MADNETLNTLKLVFQAQTEDAVKKIKNLSNALEQAKRSSAETSEALRSDLKRSFSVDRNRYSQLGSFADSSKANISKEMVRHYSLAQRSITTLPSMMPNLRPQIPEAFNLGANNLNSRALREYIDTFKESLVGLDAKMYQFTRGTLQDLPGKIFGAAATGAEKLASGIAKAGIGAATLAKNGAKFAASFSVVSMTKLSKRLNELGRAFRRILTYKTIRSAIGLVVKGFSEGIKNLYEYGKLAGTVFSTNMDKLASSALLVKNSVAAMVSPIINEITPAVEYLAQRFADLANSIGMFFAKILRQPFEKATGAVTKFGDAAKEAKKQIFGFDELNILNSPNGSGALDYSGMFEKVDVELNLDALEKQLRAAIDKHDWETTGKLFGVKLNQVLNNFNATEFGEAISNKIQAAISIVSNFLDTFSFEGVGRKIGLLLNKAMQVINFKEIGNIVARNFTALPTIIIEWVGTLDWKKVGHSISDFIVGGLNALVDWFNGVDWPKFANDLVTGISDTLSSIDWKSIASLTAELLGQGVGAIGSLLWAVGKKIVTLVKDGITGDWSGIGDWLKENVLYPFLGGLAKAFGIGDPESDTKELGKSLMEDFLEGLKTGFQKVVEYIEQKVQWVKDQLDNYNLSYYNSENYSSPSKKYTAGARAAGGYVPPGDLFYANERGPELIGSFNGRTEVYNQDTFVSALASAMTPVVQATMAIGSQITNAVNSKDNTTVLKLGDRDVYLSAQRGKTLTGGSLIQGGAR